MKRTVDPDPERKPRQSDTPAFPVAAPTPRPPRAATRARKRGNRTMSTYGPITCDLDLESPGKRTGNLRMIHSDNVHAGSVIPIPIAVIANGEGPCVVLCAGTHGNEYEGQVILRELVRELAPEAVNGRLIVMPSLNMPAVRDDTRVSPLDGANLNRVFPGAPDHGPTAAIAGFLAEVILPHCDAGIDIHTGGNSTSFLPLVYLCRCDDDEVFGRSAALAEAFRAPWTYLVTGVQGQGGFDPCAQDQGVAFISTELGGGARLGRDTLRIGRRGVRSMLAHLGVIESAVAIDETAPAPRYLTNRGPDGTLVCECGGFLETLHEPGAALVRGEPVARVHPVENGFEPAVTLHTPRDGIIVSQRTSAHVRHGDIVLDVATEIGREELLHPRLVPSR